MEPSTSPTGNPPRRAVPIVAAVAVLAVVAVAVAVVLYLVNGDDSGTRRREDIHHYVALGDSFSAAPLVPDSELAAGCFRSSNNYPNVVARALPNATLADVTCSGADTAALTGPSRTQLFLPVPAQVDALTPDTDLVTLGIGGNDFDLFSTLTSTCPELRPSDPTGAPCAAQLGDRPAGQISQIVERIETVIEAIHARSPKALVVLVGYPDLVPDEGTCDELPLAAGDYAFVDRINRELNDAVREAVTGSRVSFIDVWTASQGHDICSTDAWVNGRYTSREAFAYHPFASEQAAVADLVLHAVDRA